MDLSGVVALEVVSCSSEELPHAGARLSSRACVPVLRRLLDGVASHNVGWRAEKFCAYPQEIVCRVVVSATAVAPPQIGSLVVVSDATLIAHRIEIFVSSSLAPDWRKARFERLGFITLQSPDETGGAAQELKTVPLPPRAEPLTFLKLLLHPCHVHVANLFNQVGLACVVALAHEPTGCPNDHDATFSVAAAVRRRVKDEKVAPAPSTMRPWPVNNLPRPRAPADAHAVWSHDHHAFVTPVELLTRIQLARERHVGIVQRTARTAAEVMQFQTDQQLWATDERTCEQLLGALHELHDCERLARTVDERVATRHEIDAVSQRVRELDARVRQREAELQRQVSDALVARLANSPVKQPNGKVAAVVKRRRRPIFRDKDTWATLEPWQAREEVLWHIVEVVKSHGHGRIERGDDSDSVLLLDEALEIAMTGLGDRDAQVFVAATTLLSSVFRVHPRFQEASAWKDDVSAILKRLVARLDDHQPAVRNNAAFALVQVAELTRARGTFVVHALLAYSETPPVALSDQTLYGLLKVVSALLLSFHCCATLDISCKRVLRLLVGPHDALVHENGHVREAARQLLAVLHADVGSEPIRLYLDKRSTLPDDARRDVEQLLDVLTARNESRGHSLDATAAVL